MDQHIGSANGKSVCDALRIGSISPKDVAGEDLIRDVPDFIRHPVGDNYIGLGLESREIAHNARPKKCSSGKAGSKTTTSMPLALIRFMMPWIEDCRKLSDPAFITSR